jgi:hypothetical protein
MSIPVRTRGQSCAGVFLNIDTSLGVANPVSASLTRNQRKSPERGEFGHVLYDIRGRTDMHEQKVGGRSG